MNVTLPNGQIIEGVPEGTSKEVIMNKAISAGLATAADFPSVAQDIPTAADMPTEQVAQKEMGAFDTLAGAADIALSTGATMGKEAISGLAGLFMAPGDREGQGAQVVEQVKAVIPDYQLSRQGQEIINSLSQKYQDIAPEVLKSIVGDAMTLGPAITESTFQVTGSPLASVLAGAIPGALEAATSIKGGRAAAEQVAKLPSQPLALPGESIQKAAIDVTEGLPAPSEAVAKAQVAIQKLSPDKRKIVEAIEAGAGDKITARYLLSPEGVIKTDPLAKDAIRQGFDEGVIAAMKTASPADKAAMREMTAIRQKSKENALRGIEDRPAKVAGKSLMDRFNVVRKANRESGIAVNKAAKALKGVEIDSSELSDNFRFQLGDRLGVQLDQAGNLNFRNSLIEKNPAAKRAITDLVDIMGRGGKPDAARLHFVKKYIDDNVTYGKAAEGLGGQTETIMKEFRAEINQALQDVSPEYAAANQAYSETISALDDFQQIMGKKVDLTSDRATESVGRNLRKVMSNYNTREQLLDVIENIETVAKKHGGEFDSNILLQTLYANELDNVFGAAARTSLRGEVGGAVKDAARAASGQAGLFGAAVDVAASAAEKLRGINEENAFKSIKDFLKE